MQVSLVTPSFNQCHFLERTLKSVLSQQQVDLQYIVCDGASTDGSPALLEAYRGQIDHLLIEPDNGQADALCKGFKLATGDILGYLNSDDCLLPGTLAYVVDFFAKNPDVDLIYGHRIFVDESDRVTGFWILPPHSDYCMSRWDFIPQETCFWRSSLMEKSGGIDSSYQFAMDYDLFVRMMRVGKVRRVNRFLALFREHSDSKTTTLFETLGQSEVERVRCRYALSIRWYDKFIAHLFGQLILKTSLLFKRCFLRRVARRYGYAPAE